MRHHTWGKFALVNILIQAKDAFHARSLLKLATVALVFGLSIFPTRIQAISAGSKGDILAYVSAEDNLMLYDPQTRTQTTLLQNVASFAMARSGKAAFTKTDTNDKNIYIYDPSTPATPPISITQNATKSSEVRSWSPDGRYLAFATNDSEFTRTLHVWDGKTIQEITTALLFDTDWSQDGRLVATPFYGLLLPEIFFWDGTKTVTLSQNPKGEDRDAEWNKNGKLKFVSQRSGKYGLYVWDGVSFKNGSPDADKFVRIAPELKSDSASWTDDGLLAINVSASSPSEKNQIVLWDVDRNAEVSRILVTSDKSVSWLTEDRKTIFSSSLASGAPSWFVEIENTKGKILFSKKIGEYSWSDSGYLAYCGMNNGQNELLSLWNGSESWLVAKVSYKPAQWQNEGDTFSCNNG